MKEIEKGYLIYKKHEKYSSSNVLILKDRFTPRENHDNLITITILSNCNLNCTFCRGGVNQDLLKEYSNYKIMTTEEFKKIVTKCLESNITFFDLTPSIGEPFLDKTVLDKLEFLENYELVEGYTLTTNLLLLNESHIDRLSKLKKLILDVSLYGETKEEYFKNTQKDKYEEFLVKLEMLYERCNDLKIQFIQRCSLSLNSQLVKYVTSFRVNKKANLVTTEKYNLNRAGHIESADNKPRKRSGICPYGPGINGGIVTGGNVLFCPFHDLKREGVMGNIFTSSLREIYKGNLWQEVIGNHTKNNYTGMCENCDETW